MRQAVRACYGPANREAQSANLPLNHTLPRRRLFVQRRRHKKSNLASHFFRRAPLRSAPAWALR